MENNKDSSKKIIIENFNNYESYESFNDLIINSNYNNQIMKEINQNNKYNINLKNKYNNDERYYTYYNNNKD